MTLLLSIVRWICNLFRINNNMTNKQKRLLLRDKFGVNIHPKEIFGYMEGWSPHYHISVKGQTFYGEDAKQVHKLLTANWRYDNLDDDYYEGFKCR